MAKARRKQWQDSDMVAAMNAVKEGKGTITSMARIYHVPRRTLDDRITIERGRGCFSGISCSYGKARLPTHS